GRVGVADLLTCRAGARLRIAITPVDVEGERTRLINRGRIDGAERENPLLAANTRGRGVDAACWRNVIDRDAEAVARAVRAVLVAGGRRDGKGTGAIRVDVAHRTGVAGDGLDAAVAPCNRPARDRILSWVTRGQVQRVGVPFIRRARAGQSQRGGDIEDRDDQRIAGRAA